MTLADRLAQVLDSIERACDAAGRDPRAVQLLPISKRHGVSAILAAKAAGLSVFGENRVQELAEKAAELSGERLTGELTGEQFTGEELQWQMVGSLQTNKVRQLVTVPNLALVHSLDRIKLANALQTELCREGRELRVLLQINAAEEESKHGATFEQADALLAHVRRNCPNLTCSGLMAMGPLEGDPAPVFGRVAKLRESLCDAHSLELPTLSLGMTGDLREAIAAGSTLVRVGTGIFGARPGS